MDTIRDYPSKITTIALIIRCFCLIMTSALSFHFRKNSKGTGGTAFRKAYGELAVLRSLCKEG